MIFNEDARVKIPAILHLIRLGYEYLPLRSATWEERADIFPELSLGAVGSTTGTSNSHKRVNPTVMMQVAIPYEDRVARRLGEIMAPAAKMIAKNRCEKKRLTILREWLLPMLMNGQVTVE
jgi:hypothetical protein